MVQFRRPVEDVPLNKVGFVWLRIAAAAAIAFLAFTRCADASTGFPPDNWTGTGSQKGRLEYLGGSVMRTNAVFAIYWAPAGSYMQPGYATFVDRYLSDVATASGSRTSVYSVLTQYGDRSGRIAFKSNFGGSDVVTDSFPRSGCSYPASVGIPTCLTTAQLLTEISAVVSRRGWPRGANYLYLLFLPKNVGACTNVDTGSLETCGKRQYAFLGPCGWHDAMPYNSPASVTPYAIIPYGESDATGINPATGCAQGGQSPNGNDADATINIVSHEESEAITDPDASAWLSKDGNEIGDLCAWQYGRPPGGPAGAKYNQVIAGDHYWLQGEWSNASNSCSWGASAPTPCRTGQLAITLGHTSVGLGHEGIAIVFRSRGARCTIRGFPTVIGATSHGHDVIRAKRDRRGYLVGAVPVSTVTVSIGHPASAFAEGLDPAFCTGRNRRRYRPYTDLFVAPPRSAHGVRRRLPVIGGSPWSFCDLSIHPVTSGVTGLVPLP